MVDSRGAVLVAGPDGGSGDPAAGGLAGGLVLDELLVDHCDGGEDWPPAGVVLFDAIDPDDAAGGGGGGEVWLVDGELVRVVPAAASPVSALSVLATVPGVTDPAPPAGAGQDHPNGSASSGLGLGVGVGGGVDAGRVGWAGGVG